MTDPIPPQGPSDPKAPDLAELLRRLALTSQQAWLPTKSVLDSLGKVHGNTASSELTKLQADISDLKARAANQVDELRKEKSESETKTRQIKDLKETIEELEAKQQLDFLLRRISPEAQAQVLGNEKLREEFRTPRECAAYVMSVDLRRSTALMLKARTPQAFASFIDELCTQFVEIITSRHGVFDKFTGDGVLAFFPDFFSGKDAGYYAVQAAIDCHGAFERHYKTSRTSFSSVLTNVGLGIGIDYGLVHLLKMADGLTVVGAPVVYACRLGGAPAKATYLNQPAFEAVQEIGTRAFLMSEAELDIKHEGPMLAYSVISSGTRYEPADAKWRQLEHNGSPKNPTPENPNENKPAEGA